MYWVMKSIVLLSVGRCLKCLKTTALQEKELALTQKHLHSPGQQITQQFLKQGH